MHEVQRPFAIGGFVAAVTERTKKLKVGNPREMQNCIGPIINQKQLDKIRDQVDDAVAKGAKVLWMQLGIRNDEAAKIATDAGLDVVMNRCVKIEHARIMGGLNWAGVNTGVISSRRPVVS